MLCKKCNNGNYIEKYSYKTKKSYVSCSNNNCDFFQEKGINTGISCPISGGFIYESDKVFYVLESGMVIWKEINFSKLSIDDMVKLLKGEVLFKSNFFSKKLNSNFSGYLKYDKDNKDITLILD